METSSRSPDEWCQCIARATAMQDESASVLARATGRSARSREKLARRSTICAPQVADPARAGRAQLSGTRIACLPGEPCADGMTVALGASMPLFTRSDGDRIADLTPLRRVMPLLMRTRNESCVYYQQQLDLTETLAFLDRWNHDTSDRLTVFELIVAACGRVFHARPGLNRFVSNGRIYQRRGVQVSFAVKRRFEDDAPTDTVKLQLAAGESVRDTTQKMRAAIREYRAGGRRPVGAEMLLISALPSSLLSRAVALAAQLDRWNLLPASMMRHDPMFTSVFLANLGSLGLDHAIHHLYEYGTASVFGAVGAIKKVPKLTGDGQAHARDVLDICWTFDERINDGHYCVAALEMMRGLIEAPQSFVRDLSEDEALEASALARAVSIARPSAKLGRVRTSVGETAKGRP